VPENAAPLKALRLIAVVLVLLAVPAVAQAAPRVSAFYYPWYGNPARDGGWEHWMVPGASTGDIASSYYPARGLYSSSSAPVVRAQMREIAAAGIEEVVSSWWGWGSSEDVRLPLIVREAHAVGLSVAVHLEPYPGRNIETVEADVDHLRTLGITRIFVYQPFEISPDAWAALREREPGIELYAQTTLVGRAANAKFDGVYTYDVLLWGGGMFSRYCAQAHRVGLTCLPSVGPGYDATHATADLRVKPRRTAPLRCDVALGASLQRRRRDDHELQRVARGALRSSRPVRASAARPRRRASGRMTVPMGALAARRSERTSTGLRTGRICSDARGACAPGRLIEVRLSLTPRPPLNTEDECGRTSSGSTPRATGA
jgi:hypothetical protein